MGSATWHEGVRWAQAHMQPRTLLSHCLVMAQQVCEPLNYGVLRVLAVQVCLEEGSLICPETGRRFPVSKGIPNMLLNEDEV